MLFCNRTSCQPCPSNPGGERNEENKNLFELILLPYKRENLFDDDAESLSRVTFSTFDNEESDGESISSNESYVVSEHGFVLKNTKGKANVPAKKKSLNRWYGKKEKSSKQKKVRNFSFLSKKKNIECSQRTLTTVYTDSDSDSDSDSYDDNYLLAECFNSFEKDGPVIGSEGAKKAAEELEESDDMSMLSDSTDFSLLVDALMKTKLTGNSNALPTPYKGHDEKNIEFNELDTGTRRVSKDIDIADEGASLRESKSASSISSPLVLYDRDDDDDEQPINPSQICNEKYFRSPSMKLEPNPSSIPSCGEVDAKKMISSNVPSQEPRCEEFSPVPATKSQDYVQVQENRKDPKDDSERNKAHDLVRSRVSDRIKELENQMTKIHIEEPSVSLPGGKAVIDPILVPSQVGHTSIRKKYLDAIKPLTKENLESLTPRKYVKSTESVSSSFLNQVIKDQDLINHNIETLPKPKKSKKFKSKDSVKKKPLISFLFGKKKRAKAKLEECLQAQENRKDPKDDRERNKAHDLVRSRVSDRIKELENQINKSHVEEPSMSLPGKAAIDPILAPSRIDGIKVGHKSIRKKYLDAIKPLTKENLESLTPRTHVKSTESVSSSFLNQVIKDQDLVNHSLKKTLPKSKKKFVKSKPSMRKKPFLSFMSKKKKQVTKKAKTNPSDDSLYLNSSSLEEISSLFDYDTQSKNAYSFASSLMEGSNDANSNLSGSSYEGQANGKTMSYQMQSFLNDDMRIAKRKHEVSAHHEKNGLDLNYKKTECNSLDTSLLIDIFDYDIDSDVIGPEKVSITSPDYLRSLTSSFVKNDVKSLRSKLDTQFKGFVSRKSQSVKKLIHSQDDKSIFSILDETYDTKSASSISSVCAETDAPRVVDPLARPSKRMKKSSNQVCSDGDVWVEKILTNQRTRKRRSFFYSVKTGECKIDEPPTGAMQVIYVHNRNLEPKRPKHHTTQGDNDVWVEKILTNKKTKRQRSFFYSLKTGVRHVDEPPSGASKVIWLKDEPPTGAMSVTHNSNLDAKTPKTLKRKDVLITPGDNDIWVEKILTNKKTKRQRSFFCSLNTGERHVDEPPSGASKVIWLKD